MTAVPSDEARELFERDRVALLRRLELEQVPTADRGLSPHAQEVPAPWPG